MERFIIFILAAVAIMCGLSLCATDTDKPVTQKIEAIEVTVGDGTKATCFMSPYRGLFCIPHIAIDGVSND